VAGPEREPRTFRPKCQCVNHYATEPHKLPSFHLCIT